MAQRFRSRFSAEVALGSAAYAGALLARHFYPDPVSLTDLLAPFVLLSVLTSGLLARAGSSASSLRQTGDSPAPQQETPSDDRWLLWHAPLTYMALLGMGIALSASAWRLFFGPATLHLCPLTAPLSGVVARPDRRKAANRTGSRADNGPIMRCW